MLRFFGEDEEQPGAPATYRLKDDDGVVHDVVLRIRKVPSGKHDQLAFTHYGKKLVSKGGVTELDKGKMLAFAIDKASFALVEVVSGFPSVQVGDDKAAALFTGVLGRPITKGDTLEMNYKWNADTKALMFRGYRDLLQFVNETADEQGTTDAQDEDDLGKT